MKSCLLFLPALLILAPHAAAARSDSTVADVQALLQGQFDNRDQVAQAHAKLTALPQANIAIEPTPQVDWSLWRVHLILDAESTFDTTWAMQTHIEHDGGKALIPYYQYKPSAPLDAKTFNPQDWLSLEACALRGDFGKTRIHSAAEDYEPCGAVTTGLGSRRALLPVAIDRQRNWLNVYLSIAGARTLIKARQTP